MPIGTALLRLDGNFLIIVIGWLVILALLEIYLELFVLGNINLIKGLDQLLFT
jgi:hypothetical protein